MMMMIIIIIIVIIIIIISSSSSSIYRGALRARFARSQVSSENIKHVVQPTFEGLKLDKLAEANPTITSPRHCGQSTAWKSGVQRVCFKQILDLKYWDS